MGFNSQILIRICLLIYSINVINVLMSSTIKNYRSNSQCAIKRPNFKKKPYIFGGIPTVVVPFIVGIGGFEFEDSPENEEFLEPVDAIIICTGTILGAKWVVSVTNCFTSFEDMFVIAGTNLKYPETIEHFFFIRTVILHEEYNLTGKMENNLALAMTVQPLSNILTTSKICLPLQPPEFSMAIVAGFGNISPEMETFILRYAIVANIEEICIKHFGNLYDVHTQCCGVIEAMMLAGQDYGAPLFGEMSKQRVLLGIVSWAVNNDFYNGSVIVFTRVSAYIPWIEEKTGIKMCVMSCPDLD